MNNREKWRERVKDIRAGARHDDDDDDDDLEEYSIRPYLKHDENL